MQITNFETLLIGRFLLGVTCGMYPMLAPVMTKELSPPSLRPLLGSFFSMGRIIGIVFCFAIGVGLQVQNVTNYWRIIFIIPGIIGLVQTVMVYFFVPDVPGDLI
jgi:SP family facilitated glucose transporter-like MFS transporter 1